MSGESGGGCVGTAGGDSSSAKTAEGSTLVRRFFECSNKGYRLANCTVKPCSGCDGSGHAADVCFTSKDEAVMVVASEVGARNDDQEVGTVHTSTFKAEETGECSGGSWEGE